MHCARGGIFTCYYIDIYDGYKKIIKYEHAIMVPIWVIDIMIFAYCVTSPLWSKSIDIRENNFRLFSFPLRSVGWNWTAQLAM